MPYRRRKPHGVRNALIAIVIVVIVLISLVEISNQINQGKQTTPSSNKSETPSNETRVLLETSVGNITIQLYNDMPITSGNFKNLTEHGIYDGSLFGRIAKGFVIQGGNITQKHITVSPFRMNSPTDTVTCKDQ
jgi:hypothetical protein